jgi:hypothetical protein
MNFGSDRPSFFLSLSHHFLALARVFLFIIYMDDFDRLSCPKKAAEPSSKSLRRISMLMPFPSTQT